ncbi:MAG: formyl transferase [Oleiphilus sp.]|nr:MAG: formyl transferase [Oleiphilus sp.]
MDNDTTASAPILFLGPEDSPLLSWLREQGEEVAQTEDKLIPENIAAQGFDFLISYGYRHILSKDILEMFPNRAINLHISYLPWNRGADPNFWSFFDNTPKGVTIHYLDEGLDTGDIIVQQAMVFDTHTETLASSYTKLHHTLQSLFKQHWQQIKSGDCARSAQQGRGSSHTLKDREAHAHLLKHGWDTPVSQLEPSLRAST